MLFFKGILTVRSTLSKGFFSVTSEKTNPASGLRVAAVVVMVKVSSSSIGVFAVTSATASVSSVASYAYVVILL